MMYRWDAVEVEASHDDKRYMLVITVFYTLKTCVLPNQCPGGKSFGFHTKLPNH
jgi:hypothetical protein